MDERARRLARNQAVFREVNERIEATALSHRGLEDGHVYEYFCECSRTECAELVPLTIAQYEALRTRPNRFALVAGHELGEIEHVVEEVRPGVFAVEKVGAAADEAIRSDPRAA